MPRRRVTTGVLIATCLVAIAAAAVSLRALYGVSERAAATWAEHAAVSRFMRHQADALETDLRRALLLSERAKQAGAPPSRSELAVTEHDLLQHEIALLEASADWSAGAATLLELRQLLARKRERLVAAARSAALTPSAAPSAALPPVRGLTGDAPQAITLFERARAAVVKDLANRGAQLQARQHRLALLSWLGATGFMLLLAACGLVLYLRIVRPLQRLRSALQQAIGSGVYAAPAPEGSHDIAESAQQAGALVALAGERHAARLGALREELAMQSTRLQQAEVARERAEQASRSRADFIHQLGHELRTPLTGMLGLIDLLADDVRGATGERRLQSIQGAARALRGVLDRMSEAAGPALPRSETVELPVADGSLRSVAAAAVAEPVQPAAGARVLVAEDHAINQVVITEMLEHLGHAVEVVPDGRRAVERVRDQLFDVVLMDWSMPQMDGVAATRLIRAEESRSGRPRVKIIALTAHAFAENRQDCLAAGMDDFLAKPITVEALDTAIRRAVA